MGETLQNHSSESSFPLCGDLQDEEGVLLGMGWCRGERQNLGPGEMACESGNSEIPSVSSHLGFKEDVNASLQSAEE